MMRIEWLLVLVCRHGSVAENQTSATVDQLSQCHAECSITSATQLEAREINRVFSCCLAISPLGPNVQRPNRQG